MQNFPKKWIIKYIRSKSWFKRYQSDIVELDKYITHEKTYTYSLIIVDHFRKYTSAYAVRDKKDETVRNYMAHAFAIGDPTILHIDNRKEFISYVLTIWLENRKIRY